MEGRIVLAAVLLMFAAVMLPEVAAVRVIVGSGLGGWAPNVNYTDWVKDKHFYKGDWLYFVYDRNQVDVLEVNKTSYDTCNADHPLHNFTTGVGRDVVELNVTKTYYFISSKGYCYGGLKIAVNVEKAPPPPQASPAKNSSPTLVSAFRGQIFVPVILAVGALWDSILLRI
ncbi:lamin-like protein [Andrographis paniculata]|uniref:lamin-like protein n=1 Tax=Andrographis paniculata TaxID=175694 RepID=UPI0021E8311C|nr:lamin-like protein [Andrographis paniculata]